MGRVLETRTCGPYRARPVPHLMGRLALTSVGQGTPGDYQASGFTLVIHACKKSCQGQVDAVYEVSNYTLLAY